MSTHPRPALWPLALALAACWGWAGAAPQAGLDATQRAWVEAHPVVRFVCDPKYIPIDFLDAEGHHAGVGADYLRLIWERLGIRFERVPAKDWTEALAKVRDREADMLPVAADTPLRRDYLAFTRPHILLPAVLISARDDLGSASFADLARTRVLAVMRGGFSEERVLALNPNARIVATPDIVTTLQTVSFGLADVMLGDLLTASHYIAENKLANLRVVGQVDPPIALSMAVRKDWPQLRDILDQAITGISEADRRAVEGRWVRLANDAWNSPAYRRAALIAALTVAATLLAILVWNRALARQVRARTRDVMAAQLRLIQAAKLESVGRLAAGVAHEVKNPLAILQMGLDYLKAEVQPGGDAGGVITDMEDAVGRADTVVKGLLDFSRERRLDMQPTDLNALIDRVLRLVHHELVQHDIRVLERLDPALPRVDADPNKLEQVLINVFMNAVQAMGHDGDLIVTTETGALRQLADAPPEARAKFPGRARVVRLRVEDTGPGIDPSQVERAFDPFFTTKPVGQGTGLGLSVSRTIIDLHGGTIGLANRPQGGAVVTLVLNPSAETAT